ncbi:nuclear transport factor 2 family protein [Flavobacteriaceae bacterium M23B6Z8]
MSEFSAKQFVKEFYESEALTNKEVMKEYLHPECELFWNSSKGFTKLDYEGLLTLTENLNQSFNHIHGLISHLMQDGQMVTARYTYFANTIENPEESTPLAHFITIWELKDQKLYKGYEISQLADDNPVNMETFYKSKD